MSILNVEHLTHGFGDRAIFSDVSFRLLKGEHIGLVGANGEGKSTFMNIVTGKLIPDEGKVEWSKNVHAGYLDQHAVLEKGMTIRDVLKSAFDPLLQKEQRMNEICDLLGTADEEEMNRLMDELGTIQDELTLHDFYTIDAKVEEVARALGLLDLGLDPDTREVIYLRLAGEFSFREIGGLLGRSEVWARVRFYRGKEELARNMGGEHHGGQ